MKNLMYAAVAFCAISIGATAIGIGKAANAFGEYLTLRGSITIDHGGSVTLATRPGKPFRIRCSSCN